MQQGLSGIRVLDFSSQIAGPYASKFFADAGAEVIKVELPEGDSMRRWSATGADLDGADSPMFCFLNAASARWWEPPATPKGDPKDVRRPAGGSTPDAPEDRCARPTPRFGSPSWARRWWI